jgi:hypothetical protein
MSPQYNVTIIIDLANHFHNYLSYNHVKERLLANQDEVIITHVLDFFSFDTEAKDVIVVNGWAGVISRNTLLSRQFEHTEKKITKVHNIHKMLVAGSFTFRHPSFLKINEDYSIVNGFIQYDSPFTF